MNNFKNTWRIILLITVFFWACQSDHKTEETTGITTLSVSGIKEDYKFLKSSELLELQQMLPLETTEAFLIGEIQRVRLQDSLIFVMDRATKSALLFKDTGRFIKQIGNTGRGPHEHIELVDIEIDQYTNQLLLLDRPGKKILRYSYQGEFKDIIKLPDWYDDLYVLDKDKIVLYSGNNADSMKRFTIIDKEGEVISRFSDVPHKGLHGYRSSILAGNPDTLLYALPFDNTLYTVNNQTGKATYQIDFGGRFVTQEAKTMNQAQVEDILDKNRNSGDVITGIDDVFTVDNILYFSFNHRHQVKSALFDLETNELIKAGKIRSDEDNIIFANEPPIAQSGNQLVFQLLPSEQVPRYEELKENPDYADDVTKFSDLFESGVIDENSNPVLCFYTIKR